MAKLHKPTLRLSLLLAGALVLAACGDDDTGSSSGLTDTGVTDAAADAGMADTLGNGDADVSTGDTIVASLPVGSACTSDEQCSGENPFCILEVLRPLQQLEDSDNTVVAGIATDSRVGLPGGYCSNVAPCATDEDCGDDGVCFLPLIDIDPDEFATATGLLGVEPGSDDEALVLEFREYGQCMLPCETNDECGRAGYYCATPLEEFLTVVEDLGARLETYCIGDPSLVCAQEPCVNGTCEANPDLTPNCTCDEGYTGVFCDSLVDCGDPTVDGALSVDTSDGTTYGETITYSCGEGYDLVGTAEQTCGDDGWSDEAPTCVVIVTCDSDPCGDNGNCDDSGGSAVCTCHDGYTGDSCDTEIDCGSPGDVETPLEFDLGAGTLWGASVTYSCAEGYDLVGESTRVCLNDGWSGAAPICEISILDCTPDPCNDNGVCIEADAAFSECQCSPGWTDTFCDARVDCGEITPADGNLGVTYTANAQSEAQGFGAVANFGCDPGYDRNGTPVSKTCGADGTWSPSGEPTCTLVDCGTPPTSGQLLASTDAGTTTYLSTATYTCRSGFRLTGSAASTCTTEGTWDGTRDCEAIVCSTYTPSNTNVVIDNPLDVGFGDQVTFSCEDGYEIVGGTAVQCGNDGDGNGTWEGSEPTCEIPPPRCEADTCNMNGDCIEAAGVFDRCDCFAGWVGDACDTRIDCGTIAPTDPELSVAYTPNGSSESQGYQAVAAYTCSDGYNLTGSPTSRSCGLDETWSPAGEPTCVIADCGAPSASSPLQVSLDGATTTYESAATWSCETGYALTGDASGTCQANGAWSGTRSCELLDCGAYSPGNANLNVDNPSDTSFGDTVTFSCDMGYDISGAGNVQCTDNTGIGAWSGTEPTCTLIECASGDIPTVSEGTPSYTGSGPSGELVPGDTVTYACTPGYDWTGNPADPVICQSNRTWGGTAPTCEPGMCPSLSNPANGSVSTPNLSQGGVATYSCEQGYEIYVDGTPENAASYDRTCALNVTVLQWSGSPATCQLVDCGAAPTVVNGMVVASSTTFGSTATYTCEGGYELNGDGGVSQVVTQCQADGSWETAPTCQPVDCGMPPAAGSSAVVDAYTDTTLGATVTYSCTGDNVPDSGSASVTCLATGLWSSATGLSCVPPPPVCETDTCNLHGDCVEIGGVFDHCDCFLGYTGSTCESPVDCSAPPSPGSNARLDSVSGTTYLETATYACQTGNETDMGDTTLTCDVDMSNAPFWSGTPLSCTPVSCGAAPSIGAGVTISNPQAEYTYLESVSYSCAVGYIVDSGDASQTCQSDATFSGTPLVCVLDPLFCPAPPTPPGANNAGLDTSTGRRLSDTATYSCNTGYEPVPGDTSPKDLTCSDGGGSGVWSGSIPVCQPVDCGGPDPAPTNGTRTLSSTTYQSTVSWDCDDGYNVNGATSASCQADGMWSASAPTCDPVSCGGPPSTNGADSELTSSTGTTFGNTATYDCVTGYAGSSVDLTCDALGSWSGSTVSCAVVTCPSDPAAALGPGISRTDGGGNTYGTVATFACDGSTGYVLSTPGSTQTCSADGTWQGSVACSLHDCGAPTAGTNASLSAPTTTFGSTASYSCQTGHDPAATYTDPHDVMCALSGWDGTPDGAPLTCDIVDCGAPEAAPSNGGLSVTTTTYNSTAAYTCDPGYALGGSSSITCQADGSWSDGAPTCQLVDCGPPPATNGADSQRDSATGTTYGETANYSCQTGYNGADQVLTCDQNGDWSGTASTCTIVTCPADPTADLGPGVVRTDLGGNTYGTVAQFTCDSANGYVQSAGTVTTQTCAADGAWQGNVACELYDCGTPTSGTNASLTVMSTTFGNNASYDCSVGHNPVATYSDPHVLLCEIGGWTGTPDASALTCDPVDCDDPDPAPTNGDRNLTTTTYNSTVSWSCTTGYIVNGATSATCQGDGTWSASAPTCDPVDCGLPTAPLDGFVTTTGTAYNDIATYECNPGYEVSGLTSATCQSDAMWSVGPPTCLRLVCDVVYRFIDDTPIRGYMEVTLAPLGCDGVFEIGTNLLDPPFTLGETTPFEAPPTPDSSYDTAFMRLRFPDDGGAPGEGPVDLVEFYFPVELDLPCLGSVLHTDLDGSVGLLALTGTPPAVPASPTENRSCTSWATGTASGTALTWDTCTLVPPADDVPTWQIDQAQPGPGETVDGCAQRMSTWGATSCSGGFACGFIETGSVVSTWDQYMETMTFSSTDYSTASVTSPRIAIPDGSADDTRTFIRITEARVDHIECGTVATITCNEF